MPVSTEKKDRVKRDRTPEEIDQWVNQLIRKNGAFTTTTEPGTQKVISGTVVQIVTERTRGPIPRFERVASRVVITNNEHALGTFTASKSKIFKDSLSEGRAIDTPDDEFVQILGFKDRIVTVKTKGGGTLSLEVNDKLTIYS